jgi:hypothetical protein
VGCRYAWRMAALLVRWRDLDLLAFEICAHPTWVCGMFGVSLHKVSKWNSAILS